MPPVETTLSKLVMEYLVAEYRGSGDLEVFDALDFCDFSRRNTQRQTTDTISRRRLLSASQAASWAAGRSGLSTLRLGRSGLSALRLGSATCGGFS